MSSNEWHNGWEPANLGKSCYVELIGGETDIAKRYYFPTVREHFWFGRKSRYMENEVHRWRYVPEPPKAPEPPPPRYELQPSPISTVWACVFIAAGLFIMCMLILERK